MQLQWFDKLPPEDLTSLRSSSIISHHHLSVAILPKGWLRSMNTVNGIWSSGVDGLLRTSLDLCRFMCHIDHLSSLNLMQHFRIWSWHDFHNSLMQTFIPSYASNVTMLPFLSSNIIRLNVPNKEIIALYYLVLSHP